jgi:excisionase family DNA binding protein
VVAVSSVTEKDRDQAREVLHALGSHPRIATDDGSVLDLPAPVVEALAQFLEAAADGERALVLRAPEDLTTEQAAAVLGVSRPTVIRMIEAGKLPVRMVGTHRRLTLEDVLDYREASAARRRKALDDMVGEAEDLGLYD